MQARGALQQAQPGAFAARERSNDGYDILLTQHWGPLLRYASSILHADDAAEDIVQEAVVRLWEQQASDPPACSVAYLYRTVRNLALNERRWRRVRRMWRDGLGAEALLAPEPDNEEAIDLQVRAAVAVLPRRRREVFELARLHGLTYRQIAETLGVSNQTVANHMSAALHDLRRALGDLLGDDRRANILPAVSRIGW